MRIYNTYDDCWNAIEELLNWPGTHPEDLDDLLASFPSKFGQWSWEPRCEECEDQIIVSCYKYDVYDPYEESWAFDVGDVFSYYMEQARKED